MASIQVLPLVHRCPLIEEHLPRWLREGEAVHDPERTPRFSNP